ncbi:bacteriohemerythrin [Ideonella sp. A 288]|uniref:bacteriohemerythrin n=1 Tax=Ideonella sp. A 288 TaxID=1962181 RepID=UPI0013036220|nr:bacteriohemerythrin [Ideonella sp. A 288]
MAFGTLLLMLWTDRQWSARHLTLLMCCTPIALLAWHRLLTAAGVGSAVALVALVQACLAAAQDPACPWVDRGIAATALFVGTVLVATRDRSMREQLRHEVPALRRQAFHDRLTGLPNRVLLLDHLAMAIAQARRHGHRVGVLFIDLDGFKAINDQFGHASGDEVLRAVAGRLVGCVRAGDTVARLGGDEFAIVLAQVDRLQHMALVADKVLQAVAAPIPGAACREYRVGASIGISAFPEHGAEIDRLLAHADTAMYRSKLRGKHTATFFEDDAAAAAELPWFAFEPSHEVGVPEVDQQHRQLVLLVEGLNRAVKDGDGAEAIRTRFDELVLYTRFHFATEERLMGAAHYPALARHTQAHAQLLADVVRHRQRLNQGGELVALQTIKDWLMDHIVGEDQAMGAFLRPADPG